MKTLNISDSAFAALSELLDVNDDDDVLADAGIDPAAMASLRAAVAPQQEVSTMTNLTIMATVDDADLAAFTARDPDLTACFRARLNEVFGDDGAVLSTVDVGLVDTYKD